MTAPLAPPAAPAAPEPDESTTEAMTVEDILAALQSIIDQAVMGADGVERDLTDEEATRYEALERRLVAAQRSRELRNRQQARMAPVGSGVMAMIQSGPKPDDSLEKAFRSYLRTGRENQDLVQLRAQSEGVGSEGGYLVPQGFRQKLTEKLKAFSGLADQVEEIVTETGNNVEWPTLDDTGNVGEVVQEGGTFSAGADFVFGSDDLGAYAYMAGGGSSLPVRLSLDLVQDAAFDIEAIVARKLGERIGRIQATHWVTGTGVKQPTGITHGRTGVEAAQNTGITYNDLVTWVHSVDRAYRDNARWGFNDNSLKILRKLTDSHGDPIWRDRTAGLDGALGEATLLGYPVTIDNAFPDYSASSETVNWGVFGDLREAYVIRRVRDIQLIVNPWTRAANRQIEYTAWARADGTQQNTAAYVCLTGYVA